MEHKAYAGGLDERLELLVELVDEVLLALDGDDALRDLRLRARDDVAFGAQLVEERARLQLELLDARVHVAHLERLLRDRVLHLDDLRLLCVVYIDCSISSQLELWQSGEAEENV